MKRAKEFGIEGVTWSLTQGVVKNIIPAIASTNAIIAGKPDLNFRQLSLAPGILMFARLPVASCCNEALKIATSCAPYLNNYFMLIGTEGVYSFTFQHERKDDCPVCGDNSKSATVSRDLTVEEFLEWLVEKQDMSVPR